MGSLADIEMRRESPHDTPPPVTLAGAYLCRRLVATLAGLGPDRRAA
jgi:hypothetical protein